MEFAFVIYFGFPRWLCGEESSAGDTRDAGLIPGSGRSRGGGKW